MRWSRLGLAALVTALGASLAGVPEAVGAGAAGPAATEAGAADADASDTASQGGKSAMFLGGVYLVVFGGASTIGGLLYTTAGPGEYCPNCASSQYTELGYVALIGGFVAATTGGVLIVLGSRDNAGDEPAAAATPAVTLGPGRASLRIYF